MPIRVRLTRPLGSRPPGARLVLPAGAAQSLIGAGRAVLEDSTATPPSPAPGITGYPLSTAAQPAPPDLPDEPEPPRTGPGSSRAAWLHYANVVLGLNVDRDATRAELIAAVDRAKGRGSGTGGSGPSVGPKA